MKLKSLLVLVLLIPNLWASTTLHKQPKVEPSGYMVDGRMLGVKEAKFFDLNENGSLCPYELEIATIWSYSNKEVQPEADFNKSWLHTYFDTNLDGTIDKIEKDIMVKILRKWDDIKKGLDTY